MLCITDDILRVVLKTLISAYRLILSPLIGGQCRFYPSCSEYGLQALDNHSPVTSVWLIGRRILKCHPFNPGGYDPVSDSSPDAGRIL